MSAGSTSQTSRGSRPATCWSKSSTTTIAPSSSRPRRMSPPPRRRSKTSNSRSCLQEALIQQAEATIQATEADVTRYHLEAVRQQTLLTRGLAGTRQLVEQAVDNEKRAEATLVLDRAQLAATAPADQRARQPEQTGPRDAQRAEGGARPRGDQSRLHPHHLRRSTAWSASGWSAPASISASEPR